ncbi:hypothetical protein BJ322DRAFT_1177384 [Thelephora terrestris]|uniref:Uncharacterized protein n=1 Tax=Thelephora terrestris TaxID=56493 RepID=A0A9P6LA34_9AGAM|nr:hypothetical protein BJ322DRAFT_1177384 [Thelephora terrestris]
MSAYVANNALLNAAATPFDFSPSLETDAPLNVEQHLYDTPANIAHDNQVAVDFLVTHNAPAEFWEQAGWAPGVTPMQDAMEQEREDRILKLERRMDVMSLSSDTLVIDAMERTAPTQLLTPLSSLRRLQDRGVPLPQSPPWSPVPSRQLVERTQKNSRKSPMTRTGQRCRPSDKSQQVRMKLKVEVAGLQDRYGVMNYDPHVKNSHIPPPTTTLIRLHPNGNDRPSMQLRHGRHHHPKTEEDQIEDKTRAQYIQVEYRLIPRDVMFAVNGPLTSSQATNTVPPSQEDHVMEDTTETGGETESSAMREPSTTETTNPGTNTGDKPQFPGPGHCKCIETGICPQCKSTTLAAPNPWQPRQSYAGVVISQGSAPIAGEDPASNDDEVDEKPGLIKGFDSKKIWVNLNGRVQHDWESKANQAVLVHYLDGGYGPNLASNVRLIKEDLRDIFEENFPKEGEINPTVIVRPT